MYNLDKPIETINEDLLGRTYFIKKLASSLMNVKKKESINIGLYGEWGSGKTSIINLVIEEIENLKQNDPIDNSPLIIKFKPWNFIDDQNLISEFFKQIYFELKKANEKKINAMLTELAELMYDYSEFFDILSTLPVVGSRIVFFHLYLENLKKKKKNKIHYNLLKKS